MSRNLLIIAQMVDENDSHRASFVDWLKEFSKKFDQVFVVTVAKGQYTLPSNVEVYSLGKEKGVSKLVQALSFYKYLIRLVPRSEGLFAHASPIFVIASWPVAFMYRKNIILWYLHRSLTTKLKLAERLCYKIVTANKGSLTLESSKIIETGHGINIERFNVPRDWAEKVKIKIISVGRISPIKNFETIIEAARILKSNNQEFDIQIIGQPVMKTDVVYQKHLEKLVLEYDLSSQIQFVGLVPYNKMVAHYREADYYIGALPKGGIDRAMLEGMASGEIVFTSNKAFTPYLGDFDVIFEYNNPKDLADKIIALNVRSNEYKKNISNFMVESVSNHHRLENVISRISSLL
ncbi:MAG: glycosyltransferase [Patescibacteria group bacterium]